MRLSWVIVLVAILGFVAAWDKEDYEIFDIVAELERGEGKGTTFYSFLNVSPSASTAEITKAYRATMLANHPDKNPGNKVIADRHARLTTIGSILRNKGLRKRYDFWLKRGVPYWKGGAYLFSRFRPGLGTVLIFLTLLSAALQALVHHMNAKRDTARIARVRTLALASGKRRCRVPLRDDGDIFIDCVVEDDEVFILERDNSMELLTDEFIQRPSITRVWPVAAASKLLSPVLALFDKSGEAVQEATEPVLGEVDDQVDPAAQTNEARAERVLKASEKLRNTRKRKGSKK